MYLIVEPGFMFKQYKLFYQIDMICILVDQTGVWQWFDHNGDPQTDLPECVVRIAPGLL
jgi:hypothetical protein